MELSGRLAANPFAQDDGSMPIALATALAAADPMVRERDVAHALLSSRLLLALDPHLDAHGQETENYGLGVQDTPLGEAVLAYSCVDSLYAHLPKARPYPIHAHKLALALAKDSYRLIVDYGTANVLLGSMAINSIAVGDKWLPPWEDLSLRHKLALQLRRSPVNAEIKLWEGAPGGGLIVGLGEREGELFDFYEVASFLSLENNRFMTYLNARVANLTIIKIGDESGNSATDTRTIPAITISE